MNIQRITDVKIIRKHYYNMVILGLSTDKTIPRNIMDKLQQENLWVIVMLFLALVHPYS